MIRPFKNALHRFVRSDEGSMVVPFALWVPVFVGLLVSTIEMGTLTIRHSALERALDQTVRDIRLGTGNDFTHAGLKESICEKAAVLPSCMTTMQLEMVRLDMRNFREPDYFPDCVDVEEDSNDLRNFEQGDSNQVMFLRACYKYDPFSPAGYLGGTMMADGAGYVALIATSAFVQEPE